MRTNFPGLKLISPPQSEPVSVDELAMQLRLNDTSEYPLLAQYISATRQLFEEMTGLSVMRQQWEVFYHRQHRIHDDYFNEAFWWEALPANCPRHGHHYYLPKNPVREVKSVIGNDVRQKFWLNNTVEPAVLSVGQQTDWLRVQFWAGWDVAPAAMKQAILLQAASYYLHREDGIPGALTQLAMGFRTIAEMYRVRLP